MGVPLPRSRGYPGWLTHHHARIPDGGGWRTLGRTARQKNKKKTVPVGYAFLHSTIDDHSRVVYSEILTDEKQETAAAFWTRANNYYESLGITVKRVLSDNGSCYRSKLFNTNLGTIAHKYTRPYRHRRQITHRPRTQRQWEEQLGASNLVANSRAMRIFSANDSVATILGVAS